MDGILLTRLRACIYRIFPYDILIHTPLRSARGAWLTSAIGQKPKGVKLIEEQVTVTQTVGELLKPGWATCLPCRSTLTTRSRTRSASARPTSYAATCRHAPSAPASASAQSPALSDGSSLAPLPPAETHEILPNPHSSGAISRRRASASLPRLTLLSGKPLP